MSAVGTFISAVFLISIPAEIMYNGTMFFMQWMGFIMFVTVGAHTFMPFFMRRGNISCYQVGCDFLMPTITACTDISFVSSHICCSLRHPDFIHFRDRHLSVNFRSGIVCELNFNYEAFYKIQHLEHH